MKAETQFVLESAPWPAFLVDAQGVIRRSSQGARTVFGPVMDGDSVHLSSLWGTGNESSSLQFLGRPGLLTSPPAKINYRVKGGQTAGYTTYLAGHTRDAQKFFLFQLFPSPPASPGAPPPAPGADAATPPRSAETPAVSAESKAQLAETMLHRQKLDCALKLARTVALDFNNALTSILGHLSHTLEKMEPDHPWRRSLVEAEKAAEKAAEIANDLAAFSRQEKDTRAQPAGNLNMVLRRTAEVFQKPGAQGAGVNWNLELENRLYSVNFDEAKMQQALVKILENSVQAIAQGFKGSINVYCRNLDLSESTHDQNANLAPGSYVCVEIKDDGIGISPEVLPRVFEPFFTTKHGHRGLGLAWVYGIITNHGGSVAISSEVGTGTSVRLYLPATKKIVRDTDHKKLDLRGEETILMVDDEDLLLTMGQMVLSSFGYKVLTANSGEKALSVFKHAEGHIDLLVTDVVMPQMSGRELAEHVRRVSPTTRIIYSSGYVRPASGEEDNYLQKPFTSQDLVRKVKHILTGV